MTVRPDFQFSQNNLQDYIDCSRRFQLRHILQQKWPAVQSQPVVEQERHMQQGARFHNLVYQHQLGLPAESLQPLAAENNLGDWWQNYLERSPRPLPARRYPEFTLTAPFAGFRILAKYDLLAVDPGQRVMIVDWKTSLKAQSMPYLRERMQSRLYPFLAVLAGSCINNGSPVQPEQVEMVYWFANEPENVVRFAYNQQRFYEDQQFFYNLISEIAAKNEGQFTVTGNAQRCVYCTYRSLCGRGESAGPWQEDEDQQDRDLSSLDFDAVGEIRF